MIVADTSFVIDLLRRKGEAAKRAEQLEENEEIAITPITVFELLQSAYHRKLESEKTIAALVGETRVLPFDAKAADESARVMGSLLRIGKPINVLDVMVTGCAIANGASRVVSADRDFLEVSKVCDLKVEVL